MLEDKAAERALLSGVVQYGGNVWIDVNDLLNDECFSDHINNCVYSVLKHVFSKNNEAIIDLASIMSAASDLGLQAELAGNTKYIKALFSFHIEEENVRGFARKLRRLAEYKGLVGRLDESANAVRQFTGDESISDATAIAEKPIFDFTNKLIGGENQIKLFGEDICEYVEDVIANPRENNGIPIPFTKWANAIGGLSAGIHLVAARSGIGKSTHALNIALHTAAKEKIPTLLMDNELYLRGGNYDRALARITNIEFYKINKGQFTEQEQEKIRKAARFISKIPLSFINIGSMDFDSVVSLVRKWILKETGREVEGNYRNALLIYDYIKLTDYADLKNAREYEIIGHRMNQLHSFTVEYKLPVIAYIQHNRQMEVSQSDRCNWMSTSVSSLEEKTPEEIAEGILGNRKIYVRKSRWGEGLAGNNFINYNLNGKVSNFVELETAEEFRKKEKERKEQEEDCKNDN